MYVVSILLSFLLLSKVCLEQVQVDFHVTVQVKVAEIRTSHIQFTRCRCKIGICAHIWMADGSELWKTIILEGR